MSRAGAAVRRGRTNYVILFQGRAGSSFLIDVLGRLPHIVAEGEMLVDIDAGDPLLARLRGLVRRRRQHGEAARQLAATRAFYGARWHDAQAAGFKTKISDVHDLTGFARVLREFDVRAIVLERRNLVKQAVSHLNAARLYEQHGEWNLAAGRVALGPFAPDPRAFDDALRRAAFLQDVLDAFVRYLCAPTLRLEYDELLRDPKAWIASVCELLGVPAAAPASAVAKNTDDDLRNVLLNFDELRSRYERTPYAPMFDERAAV